MRPARPLTYRIERLPEVPAVLGFLVEQEGLDAAAAYSTFNMGAGYALYCRPGGAEAIVESASRLGLRALLAGRVEEGPRQVILEPVGVRFEGDAARAVRGARRGQRLTLHLSMSVRECRVSSSSRVQTRAPRSLQVRLQGFTARARQGMHAASVPGRGCNLKRKLRCR